VKITQLDRDVASIEFNQSNMELIDARMLADCQKRASEIADQMDGSESAVSKFMLITQLACRDVLCVLPFLDDPDNREALDSLRLHLSALLQAIYIIKEAL